MEKEKKPVAKKKPAPKKRKAVAKKKPQILSYAIKMVIPTVQYGNIQPEIIVKANSIDEAHDFIVPHMNKLWKEYYLVDGRRPESAPAPAPVVKTVVVPPVKEESPIPGTPENTPPAPEKQSPTSSVAFVKATQAINSCMSAEALQLIIDQVYVSVKLTDEDKIALAPLLDEKYKELNEKQ